MPLRAERRANAAAVALAIISMVLCGCHRFREPASDINMADSTKAGQLLRGFYPIENNSWRWVGHNFLVALKPVHTAGKGARLILQLYFPTYELEQLGPITLSATIDRKSLGSEVFDTPGRFDFIKDVSARDLDTNILPVQFCFDKSLPESPSDKRELAAVVTRISLVARQ